MLATQYTAEYGLFTLVMTGRGLWLADMGQDHQKESSPQW